VQITDKLAAVRAYRAAGIPREQAEAMAEEHEAAAEEIHQQLTKSMTEALTNATKLSQASLEAAIAKATAEQNRFTLAVGAFGFGLLALLMAAFRFLH